MSYTEEEEPTPHFGQDLSTELYPTFEHLVPDHLFHVIPYIAPFTLPPCPITVALPRSVPEELEGSRSDLGSIVGEWM